MPAHKKTPAVIEPENLAAVKKLVQQLPTQASHEAAQDKLRRLEIRGLEKTRKKIRADFRNEQKQLIKTAESAHKAVLKFQARAEKQLPKLEADIDRRVGILRGRLGI